LECAEQASSAAGTPSPRLPDKHRASYKEQKFVAHGRHEFAPELKEGQRDLWYVSQFTFAHDTFIRLVDPSHAILKLAVTLWQFLSDDVCPSWNVSAMGGNNKYSLTNLEFVSRHGAPPRKPNHSLHYLVPGWPADGRWSSTKFAAVQVGFRNKHGFPVLLSICGMRSMMRGQQSHRHVRSGRGGSGPRASHAHRASAFGLRATLNSSMRCVRPAFEAQDRP
jgi:hypothetical protein